MCGGLTIYLQTHTEPEIIVSALLIPLKVNHFFSWPDW